MAFKVVIPARYASSRLPGKPLLQIGNRSLLEHVYRSAASSGASEVVVATDDQRIADHAARFGAKVIMTSSEHQSGTDRIQEALTCLNCAPEEIIVNVQGDEYGLAPELISHVATALAENQSNQMATLCERITDPAVYTDPNSVKVVMDNSNTALYFSRASIPWSKPPSTPFTLLAYKHIGIYAYRAGFLQVFSKLPHVLLEQQESLEQLRALFHGYRIHVAEVPQKTGIEINTAEDLARARAAWGKTEN
jgi:3-deoxy-manno-octulosonate cytidylyltransferase (CMP-KDO synthetase)